MKSSFSKDNNENSKVILFGVSISPYVRKVMVALAEKNIDFESREILPKIFLEATGQKIPEDFLNASPLGKIPALQVNNFCISDSAVICQYLDQKFNSGNSLYPENPEERAKALWFEKYADTELTEIVYKKIFLERVAKPAVFKQNADEKLVNDAISKQLPPLLDYLNHSVSKSEWISGKQFSLGDIAIVTQLLALKMAGFEIDQARWNKLKEYMDKATKRNSFHKLLSTKEV